MIPLLFGLASPALAGPCDADATGLGVGPVSVGFQDGDLGVARRLCPRTAAGLSAGGLAVVDTANFYGHIAAGGTLEGSWAMSERTELYATLEAFRYDTVITPIPATYAGFGHVGLGATHRFWENEKWGVGVHGRAVLPTAIGLYRNAYPLGLDVGVGATFAATPAVTAFADVGVLGSAAVITRGPALPRAGATAVLGAELRPARWFSWTAELASGFGYAEALDHLAAGTAFRFGVGKRVGIELAAAYPFAGRERALASGELRVDVRLGKLPDGAGPRPVPAAPTDTSDTSHTPPPPPG